MTSQFELNHRYITSSGTSSCSNVYDLKSDYPVIINGEQSTAINIKVGDDIDFLDYSHFHKKILQIKYKVKFVGYSQFPSNCFTGECLIQTINGFVHANTLCVGDIILSSEGIPCSIKCILETKINQYTNMLIHPNGLKITGYHPVKINGEWIFPNHSDSFEKQYIYVDSIYSIGLDQNGTSFDVDGIEVIGLGHNIIGHEILSHPYFGTNLIIDDIFKLAPDGYCVVVPEQTIRDEKTKLVCGIVAR